MDANQKQRGVVGLKDLGNISFINTIIQCLAQSPQLTQIFLNNDYQQDINKNNPLGYSGRIAQTYAMLLQQICSNKQEIIEPTLFKTIIQECASRFFEGDQQDSSEFLSFLLNGLHEDLNRILNKPFTESVEVKGRSDDIVALESWTTYLKRNDSIFVNILHGQNKSKIECPDCGKISIKFDPFIFLSLPIPTNKYKTIRYTWIDSDTSIPATFYGQKILKIADADMLKEAVKKSFNKKPMVLTNGS